MFIYIGSFGFMLVLILVPCLFLFSGELLGAVLVHERPVWEVLVLNQGVRRLFCMFNCFEENMNICHPWHALCLSVCWDRAILLETIDMF